MGKPLDIKAVRKRLNLNLAGFCLLLRMSKASASTIIRWQEGKLAVPGSTALLFEILLKVPVARKEAGVDELAARYPYRDRPGRPPPK